MTKRQYNQKIKQLSKKFKSLDTVFNLENEINYFQQISALKTEFIHIHNMDKSADYISLCNLKRMISLNSTYRIIPIHEFFYRIQH